MIPAVSPDDATNKTVTWSVIAGTGNATIDANGLLTAVGVGTVTVKATANDGSAVSGDMIVTVTSAPMPVDPSEPPSDGDDLLIYAAAVVVVIAIAGAGLFIYIRRK